MAYLRLNTGKFAKVSLEHDKSELASGARFDYKIFKYGWTRQNNEIITQAVKT